MVINSRAMWLFYIVSVILTFSYENIADAAISQRRAATWNLQGSSAKTEAKWSVNIRQVINKRDSPAVLAVQEAGTPPDSAKRQGDLGNRLINPQDLKQEVHEYEWNLGSASKPDIKWIYYTKNDESGNRVNLALVTNQRPDHVIIFRSPGDYKSVRPILGVQFNKDNYFTIHASSKGGGDAASIINVIANYFGSRQEYDHQFMIMGDFNREPPELRSSLERQHPDILKHIGIYHTGTPTHSSGKILDYAVIGQYSYDLPHHLTVHAVDSTFIGQLASDHTPVVFNIAEH